MASIAGLYGGSYGTNQEDGSGGRAGFFGGLRSVAANKKGAIADHLQVHAQAVQVAAASNSANAAAAAAAAAGSGNRDE